MYCLANICYVCLEKKSKLITNINRSSVNVDIIHIIGYLPINLAWLKSLKIILICEECCVRLRETYQFFQTCLKKSALLQGYMDNLNITPNTEKEAELLVKLNITHEDTNEVKCEIQSEDEEWQPNIEEIEDVFVDFEDSLVKERIICKKEVDDKQVNNSTEIIEETEDVFVNVEDYFVKEENTCKREEVDDTLEYPTDTNCSESVDNESNSEISVRDNAHLLNIHTGIHTSEKPYECAICKTRFSRKINLVTHMRTHTGEKPHSCSKCKKCFNDKPNLVRHMRVHTGEKPYSCSICKTCFTGRSVLVRHIRVHTGEKPYSCSRCKKCFTNRSILVTHMRIHTGDKPYNCSRCKKCFSEKSNLTRHMRIHTGEKPYSCSSCKKCFSDKTSVVSHMRVHTGEKQ